MKKSFSLFALALLFCTGATAQSYQWAKSFGGTARKYATGFFMSIKTL